MNKLISISLLFFSFSSYAMTPESFRSKYKEQIEVINSNRLDPEQKRQITVPQVAEACVRILSDLQNWPSHDPKPADLFTTAGRAYGQLSYLSPWTLRFFDSTVARYLKSGQLNHAMLKTHYWNFQFGATADRSSHSPHVLRKMINGQTLSVRYHLNDPLYFNRTFSEFEGDYLLIGGGEHCECMDSQSRHPKNLYYTVDIDNSHQPDLVMHSSYLAHLAGIPSARFSLIWFEHSSVSAFHTDENNAVLEEYFRIMKPGGALVYQTNFLDDVSYDLIKMGMQKFVTHLKSLKMSVSLVEEKSTVRNGRTEGYFQVTALKPNLKPSFKGVEFSHPGPGFHPEYYQELDDQKKYFGFLWAQLLTSQKKLSLTDPVSFEEFQKLIE